MLVASQMQPVISYWISTSGTPSFWSQMARGCTTTSPRLMMAEPNQVKSFNAYDRSPPPVQVFFGRSEFWTIVATVVTMIVPLWTIWNDVAEVRREIASIHIGTLRSSVTRQLGLPRYDKIPSHFRTLALTPSTPPV